MADRTPDVITIAITRVDGGVTIMRVIVNDYAPDGKGGRALVASYEPTTEYVDSLIQKHVDSGSWVGNYAPVSWRFVPNDYVDENTDRYFRGAWKDGNGKPEVDMAKAREIHRNKLRELRQPKLEALDVAYMRADEGNGDKKAIATRKQILRNVTDDPRIDEAKTPEELKAVLPEALAE